MVLRLGQQLLRHLLLQVLVEDALEGSGESVGESEDRGQERGGVATTELNKEGCGEEGGAWWGGFPARAAAAELHLPVPLLQRPGGFRSFLGRVKHLRALGVPGLLGPLCSGMLRSWRRRCLLACVVTDMCGP